MTDLNALAERLEGAILSSGYGNHVYVEEEDLRQAAQALRGMGAEYVALQQKLIDRQAELIEANAEIIRLRARSALKERGGGSE